MFQERYAQLPLFRGLSKEQIDRIEPLFQLCRFSKNHTIFQQGQTAQFFYILLKGEVEIRYKPYDAPPLMVARLAPGSVFGWSSVLGRDTYTSAAIALLRSDVYCTGLIDLKKMIRTYPETGDILLDRLAGVIAERIRSTHTKVLALIKEGL
jgi:CRP-like cAMP-binding protein